MTDMTSYPGDTQRHREDAHLIRLLTTADAARLATVWLGDELVEGSAQRIIEPPRRQRHAAVRSAEFDVPVIELRNLYALV